LRGRPADQRLPIIWQDRNWQPLWQFPCGVLDRVSVNPAANWKDKPTSCSPYPVRVINEWMISLQPCCL
jgi:hypothetical protein